MINFDHQPIQRKLMILVLSAMMIAMLIVTVSVTLTDQYFFRKTFVEEIKVLAELTAKRSSAALLFNDRKALASNVDALFIRRSIEQACIYDSGGALILERSAQTLIAECEQELTQIPELHYVDDKLLLMRPISVKNRKAGVLQLQISLSELQQRLWEFICMLLLIGAVAVTVAWRLTLRLQKLLVSPIIELSLIANVVSRSSDYTMRVGNRGGDEIGRLVAAFNRLMDSVQNQEIELQKLVVELKEKNSQIENQVEISEERNNVIREMFSAASHDLRQPLQAMLIFVGALKEISTDKQVQLLAKLEFAIDNMSQLFTDLLDVSKVEAKLEGVSLTPVSLTPLLDRVFHEFDALAKDKNLSLRFNVGSFVVESNPGMLERIVRNLLSNAIRYTNQGGVLLACRLRGNKVRVEVWDSGRGIDSDQLNTIFKQFVQLENVSEESRQGVGLGLSIVKRLSDLLEHQLSVRSRPGRGTVFRVEIPLYIDSKFHDTRPVSNFPELPTMPPLEPSLPLQHNKSINIMLVDDDDEIRVAIQGLLEIWEMKVTSLSSVADINSYFNFSGSKSNTTRFDVIVSDFQLQNNETGLEAIALIRHYTQEQTPALIVTGANDDKIFEQIKSSGFQCLKKPVKPAKLRALINHLV